MTPALQAPDSFLDNDFIILTKEVEGAGIGKTSFTQTELAELAEQPFTEALGEFTPARYSVMGGISLAGIGMRTYLFFESVPDRFLDVRSDEWGFEEGSEFVPIILPRNYLNLYNFGFASTRGLPQVSEDLVRGITLDLDLSGRGQFRNLKGRVVAFSNRLNTILVPEEFIRWSNRRFADKPAADPSRIILEVRNAADDRIHEYLALHRYQIEGGAGDEGRASYFLRMATGVVVGVGLLITVLSFFILLLSIFLMLQKNLKVPSKDLLMLGCTPAQVAAAPISCWRWGWTMSALACAVPVVVWVRSKYLPMVRMLGEDYAVPGIWGMLLAGIVVVGAVVLIDMLVIRHKVNGLWTQR
ncbi:MAG: ABC transporter permease [Alistipes putredinis]